MQTRKYKQVFLGIPLTFDGPALVSELEAIVGKDACIEAFMTAYSYQRSTQMSDPFCQKLEQLTGEERKYEVAKDGEGKPKTDRDGNVVKTYTETPGKFLARLQTDERFRDVLTDAEVAKIAEEVSVDQGPWTFKVVSDRKPAAAYYELADSTLAKIDAGLSTQADSIAKIEAKLGVDFAATFGEYNRDNLARAAKAIADKRARETADDMS